MQPLGSDVPVHRKTAVHRSAEGEGDAVGKQGNLARVNAGSGDNPYLGGLRRIADQGEPGPVDFQVFRASVRLGRHRIKILGNPAEGPHEDLAVAGGEEVVRVVGGGHDRQRHGVQGIRSGGVRHQRPARRDARPVHQAAGDAVQCVGIAVDFHKMPEIDSVVGVSLVVAAAEPGAGRTALHVPVPGAVAEEKVAVIVFRHREGGLVLFVRKGQAVVAAVIDILLRHAVGRIAVGVHLIFRAWHLLEEVQGRIVGGIALGGLGLGDAHSGIVARGGVPVVAAARMTDVEAIRTAGDQLRDA